VHDEPVGEQVVGQPAGALGELPVGQAQVTPDDRLAVGHGGGHGVVDDGEVEVHLSPWNRHV
jgi:hypothetical protein